MSSRNFETFSLRATPIEQRPLGTIQRRHSFSLNRTAYEALGRPAAVELLFDRDDQVLGLRPVDPSERHAYPVRRQQASESYLLAFQAFARYYGIPVGEPRRYEGHMEDGILVFDLKQEPIPMIDRRRSRETSQPHLAGVE